MDAIVHEKTTWHFKDKIYESLKIYKEVTLHLQMKFLYI